MIALIVTQINGSINLMMNLRYKDIIPSLEDTVFHIFGCGAIGSAAAIQLTRMGAVNFVMYDMDRIEAHNIGVSNYNHNHMLRHLLTGQWG